MYPSLVFSIYPFKLNMISVIIYNNSYCFQLSIGESYQIRLQRKTHTIQLPCVSVYTLSSSNQLRSDRVLDAKPESSVKCHMYACYICLNKALLIIPFKYLNFPKCFAGSCRRSRCALCFTEKNILFLLINIKSQKLFLAFVEQANHIATFQNSGYIFCVVQKRN